MYGAYKDRQHDNLIRQTARRSLKTLNNDYGAYKGIQQSGPIILLIKIMGDTERDTTKWPHNLPNKNYGG
jgi:hypothetical protein